MVVRPPQVDVSAVGLVEIGVQTIEEELLWKRVGGWVGGWMGRETS